MTNLSIYGKVPPNASELETAVLGAIMIEKSTYDEVSEMLVPESFYSPSNETVYRAMVNLVKQNKPIDELTVCEELQRMGELEKIGGPFFVTKLTNAVVSSANIKTHAAIIQDKYVLRELIKVCGNLLGDAYSELADAGSLLTEADKAIALIADKSVTNEMVHISTVISHAHNKIEEWRRNDTSVTGVSTGFSDLDQATRGWQPGDLILLAARPSVGKTAFALSLIRNAALGIKPTTVAVWSLEMKSVYLILRMLAAESDIILNAIQTGDLSDNDMADLINKGMKKLSAANIFFDDTSTVNFRTIQAKCRRLKKKNQLGLIVIDYLQLMQTEGKNESRNLEIGGISRDLKNLAQELEVPVIALSQLNREAEKHISWESGPPKWTLRDSGSLEQDADLILMLWGPNEAEILNDKSLEGKRRLKIAKQRNGVCLTLQFDFQQEIQLFKSIVTF